MVHTIDPTRRPCHNKSQPAPQQPKKSVAIIGLGMAGCVAAHFLQHDYDITCFEQMPVPGLFAHSLTDLPGGTAVLDMPLRAVSPHYYKNLVQLYSAIGVELQQTNYQHTVVDADTKQQLFSYVNLCILGFAIPLPYLSPARFFSAFLVLLGFLQFVFCTPLQLWWSREHIAKLTLSQFLNEYNSFNPEFQHLFFYPILSTLLSCSYAQVQQYPAVLICEFICSGVGCLFTGWFRVRGLGVYGVAQKLLKGLEARCHFDVRVIAVSTKRRDDGTTCVEVATQSAAVAAHSASFTSRTFDHVVVAVEPDIARRLVVTDLATAEGRGVAAFLNSTASFTADIIAHRDKAFMSGLSVVAAAPTATTNGNGNGHSHAGNGNGNGGFTTSMPWKPKCAEMAATNSNSKSPNSSNILTRTVENIFPFIDAPSTGLTVFATGVDAAAMDPFIKAPRNASTTTANIAMMFGSSGFAGAGGAHQSSSDSSALNSSNGAPSSPTLPPPPELSQLFETWNPIGTPRHIVKRARMTRAVWTLDGLEKWEQHARHAQGHGNIWFAGSYCARGVTLLEQAMTSALDVAQDFGCQLPFTPNKNVELNAAWWMLLVSMVVNWWVLVFRIWWKVLQFNLRVCIAIKNLAVSTCLVAGRRRKGKSD